MVLVTDKQYYMNHHLKDNLDEIPRILKKDYDCVIILTGHGRVRVGKSTLAQQIGYYISWLRVGGDKKPKKTPVVFDNNNIVFTPDDLMKKAETMPRNSVIIYDEGRAGLDSARAMESINKGMMDFFQECGQYGHVIIVVLPNFFRLSEDIAVPRSLFLLDVYTDAKYNRGYFKFYNDIQKEFLYVFGKRKLGTYAKYKAAYDSFSGRFTKATPGIDNELYKKQKRESLKKRRKARRLDKRLARQRNESIYRLYMQKIKEKKIAEWLRMSQSMVSRIVDAQIEEKEKDEGERDESEKDYT